MKHTIKDHWRQLAQRRQALANHTTQEWAVRLELEIVTEAHFGDAANKEDLSTIE